MTTTLLYIGSKYIETYLDKHPIDWSDRELARIGGAGDQAGVPPIPSVKIFIEQLQARNGELFTQRDYLFRCWDEWSIANPTWYNGLKDEHKKGLRAKAYRNFYPSLIDSLHVWSLLSESSAFERCEIDAMKDAVGKTDITVYANGKPYQIALLAGSANAVQCRQYKKTHRNGYDIDCFAVKYPSDRSKGIGNKHWFELRDFADVFKSANVTP